MNLVTVCCTREVGGLYDVVFSSKSGIIAEGLRGASAVIVPARDLGSRGIWETNILLAEVGVGGLDEGGELTHLLVVIGVSVPGDVGIPELVVVVGVGGGALLELGDVDGVGNVEVVGKVLVVDHLELGELALGAGTIADELVEEGVGLLVVEEHVGTLVGELGVVGDDVLADTDVGGAGVATGPLRDATSLACLTIIFKPGGAADGVGSGGRIEDGGVSASTAIRTSVAWIIEALTGIFVEVVDAEAPLAEVATVFAADAGADGHAGVLAVVGDLDALVLAGDSGLIERRDPVSPHGAGGGDSDGGNESLQGELHGCGFGRWVGN